MAAYDLQEQEQIENLKAWWKQYGNLAIGCVCAAAIAVAGWTTWSGYQTRQDAQSGEIYAALQQAIRQNEEIQVRSLTGELTDKFGNTSYAALGVLIAARHAVGAGDAKTAKAQLAWAIEHGKDEFADIARLRLAGLLLDENEHDEAIKLLDHPPAPAFAASYAELKGDVFFAKNDAKAARAAWQEAKTLLENNEGKTSASTETSITLMLLQQKIDALGGAAA
ncbi:MAG: tetratricopeptide repeat protein [Zoogloeaceae bacterium]|jgi:predicted negative regulator of RcsB-dependent stress response|nr:tetratricopeptide repeat protein [Zoogloeaceae bacterium]